MDAMDAMDDETRRRLEEEIVELQAKLDEAKKKTFSSQKERRKELNRIGQAIRHKKNNIKNPGRATQQKRELRQQKREQEAMNSKNNSNDAHRGLDSSLVSSVSHIAVHV
jgi:chorismate mutase